MIDNSPNGAQKPSEIADLKLQGSLPKAEGTYQRDVNSFVVYLEGLPDSDKKTLVIGRRLLSPSEIAAELRKDPQSFKSLVEAFAHEIANKNAGGEDKGAR